LDSKYIDTVCVVERDCEELDFGINAPNVYVLPSLGGLAEDRSLLVQEARRRGAFFSIQCDDDTVFTGEAIDAMIEIAIENPFLGGVCLLSQLHFYYARELKPNKNWGLSQRPATVFGARLEAYDEVGEYDFAVCEDLDFGLRLWSKGWGVAHVHNEGLTYAHKVPARKKTLEQGGIPELERMADTAKVIPPIVERHGPNGTGTLKFLRLSAPGSMRAFNVRYDWDVMLQRFSERWGSVGYTDAKGKKL